MSTNAVTISISNHSYITGGLGQYKDLITSTTKTDQTKTADIVQVERTSFTNYLSESLQIQPVLFSIVILITTWSFVDIILFITRNNYLLHPYINFIIFVAGAGLFNTFLIGGKEITNAKNSKICLPV